MAGASKTLKVLLELERNETTQVRWSVDEFTPEDGKPSAYVSVRKWWRDKGGEWKPTREGVTIHLAELDKVMEALERVRSVRDKRAAQGRRT